MSIDMNAVWDESASEEDVIATYQHLIDTGMAWTLEGHVGRTATALIDAGLCTLGPTGHKDYYGNYVPSRDEVQPGTPGSEEYARQRQERD